MSNPNLIDVIIGLEISYGVKTYDELVPKNYLMETYFDNNSLNNLMLQNINGISRFTS